MKRMTDEQIKEDRSDAGDAMDLDCDCYLDSHEAGCFEDAAAKAMERLEADHDRARAREAWLEATLRDMLRSSGHLSFCPNVAPRRGRTCHPDCLAVHIALEAE
jgi:hypothetical protein